MRKVTAARAQAARLIEEHDLAFAESARLLNEAANYSFERAQYPEAEPLFKRALAIRERVFGAEHSDVAMSLAIWPPSTIIRAGTQRLSHYSSAPSPSASGPPSRTTPTWL